VEQNGKKSEEQSRKPRGRRLVTSK